MRFRRGSKDKDPETGEWLRGSPDDGDALNNRFKDEEETPTQFFDTGQSAERTEDPETRILKPEANAGSTDNMQDPPVGFLMVVAGPGKGAALQVGYGVNSIGRGVGQRISVDFGDDRISRENHAAITYDDQSRTFYVQHGGGVTLTYLRDEPLLTPQKLNDRDLIKIGDTALMFIAVCAQEFDWLAPTE